MNKVWKQIDQLKEYGQVGFNFKPNGTICVTINKKLVGEGQSIEDALNNVNFNNIVKCVQKELL